MGSWCVAACTAALLCALAQADMELDKRSELSPVPFVMGSRYGRSPATAPRLMTPRNDRFFMGSRYGKRSLLPPVPPAPPLPPGTPGGPGAHAPQLVCEFTGIAPLYRCERRALLPYNDRKSNDDLDDGDEE